MERVRNIPDMIIHTPTIEDYMIVISWVRDMKISWYSAGSKSINKCCWDLHKDRTCIIIRHTMRYCSKYYADCIEKDILNMVQFYKYAECYFGLRFGLK